MNFVYDRTLFDVENASRIQKEKVAKGIELTETDITILSKGAFTRSDINRIQSNILSIGADLENMGYYFQESIKNTVYDENDIFYQEDLQYWCDLVDKFKKAFFVYVDTPIKPLARYSYNEINKLEKILFDLNERSKEIKSLYRECGNYECGESNG